MPEKTTRIKRVSFPKVNLTKIKFNSSMYVPLMVILLVVAAFLIGVLVTKVSYLEKGVTTSVSAGDTSVAASSAPSAPKGPVDVSVGHLPPLGDANAPVKFIEFADLRCPFCEQFFTQAEDQIVKNYVDTGKASFYFRHYAFLGDASVVAANAAECANEQSAFWAMHDYLYKNQPSESDTSMYTTDKLTEIAGTLGLNTSQFSSCLSSKKYQKNVDTDLSEGGTAGVTGTPSFFINGRIITGACPYSTISAAIDAELQHKNWGVDDSCQLTIQ